MKRECRVFTKRTSYTPTDADAYFDVPDLFTPRYEKVLISCCFTWDKPLAERLKEAWLTISENVEIGGVAYNSPCYDFAPGRFVRYDDEEKIVFTSRGCPNNCGFCLVPTREGQLRELPIVPGNIIQDNNFLACSRQHKNKVFEMLKKQKKIKFKGGLEADLLDNNFIENVKGVQIKELWLACDSRGELSKTINAVKRLKKAGFSINKINCYVLGGYDLREEYDRCRELYLNGAMPFLQLYRDVNDTQKYDVFIKRTQRVLSRPAATKSVLEKYKTFEDYIRTQKDYYNA